MNDTERQQWVDNDESLYYWQRASAMSKRDFIRENRTAIDAHIHKQMHRYDGNGRETEEYKGWDSVHRRNQGVPFQR